MRPVRILAAKTHLGGKGLDVEALERGLKLKPDFVGLQGATGDFGPHFLGAGTSHPSVTQMESELDQIVPRCIAAGIPFVIGGAPSAGSRKNIETVHGMLKQVAARHRLRFKMATIYADVDPEWLIERAESSRIEALEHDDDPLTAEKVLASSNIVAFMGWEPVVAALDAGADIIVTGRICDDHIYAAAGIRRGVSPAMAWHAGKIMECGSMCGHPHNTAAALMVTIEDSGFTVELMADEVRCTVESITAHNLYERKDAFEQEGPAGTLVLHQASFEQLTPRAVRVSGAQFRPKSHTLLVEGAGPAGYRALSVASVRDPVTIARLPKIQAETVARIRSDLASRRFEVAYHNYGLNGTMSEYESEVTPENPPHEVGIVTVINAETQELASDVCQRLHSWAHMIQYEGRVLGEGNYATPFSPVVQEVGLTYRYTINHLVPVSDKERADIFVTAWHSMEDGELRTAATAPAMTGAGQ